MDILKFTLNFFRKVFFLFLYNKGKLNFYGDLQKMKLHTLVAKLFMILVIDCSALSHQKVDLRIAKRRFTNFA